MLLNWMKSSLTDETFPDLKIENKAKHWRLYLALFEVKKEKEKTCIKLVLRYLNLER